MTKEDEEILKLIEERKDSEPTHTLKEVMKQFGFTEDEIKGMPN